MIERLQNHRGLLICVLLAIVTVAVYLPVINYEFLNYDDDIYVVGNPHVRTGLSLENIKWGFTAVHETYWQPLTWLSYMLDCTLFGVNAGASHLINVVFHAANAILLFLVLVRMTKCAWQSAFAAALFALHPLHVESVAWIAERRDVLSTLFWLLTMLFYARYAERPSWGRYLATVAAFILGLLSKPMLVTLPFVLLLLDYWPLERFGDARNRISRLLLEKAPFIILSAIASATTFLTSRDVGAIILIPLKERVVNAICSYGAYIYKMFWPVQMAVFYPHPTGYLPASRAVIYGTALVLITAFVIYYGRRHKYLLMGWLWYLGTLVPVIGIVQVGSQAMADRYTYVSFIGLFIIISFGVSDLLGKTPFKKFILTAAGLILLFSCVLVTSAQLKYWKNSYVLFERAIKVVEGGYASQNNNTIASEGADERLPESLKTIPNSPIIYNNFANALRQMGRLDEAIKYYRFALELAPDFSLSRYNLGQSLIDRGKYEEAITQYKIYLGGDINAGALRDKSGALSRLGYAQAQSGKADEAIKYYRLALEIDSNDILTHGRYAIVLSSLGRIDEAIEQCRIVLKAMPNDAEMHNNLGVLLQAKGDIEQAAESYRKVLQINPNFQKARDNLEALTNQKESP